VDADRFTGKKFVRWDALRHCTKGKKKYTLDILAEYRASHKIVWEVDLPATGRRITSVRDNLKKEFKKHKNWRLKIIVRDGRMFIVNVARMHLEDCKREINRILGKRVGD
jgi:glucan phosphorylase